MSFTSALGAAVAVEGTLLQVAFPGSPENFVTIANVTDLAMPVIAKTVEVTNVGDAWVRRFATLHDMGKITCKIFWVMEEPTHRNSVGSSTVPDGLRYMLINSVQADFQIVYPNGPNNTAVGGSIDAFPAFVTSFAITGKTGDVYNAMIEFSNNGAPSLC